MVQGFLLPRGPHSSPEAPAGRKAKAVPSPDTLSRRLNGEARGARRRDRSAQSGRTRQQPPPRRPAARGRDGRWHPGRCAAVGRTPQSPTRSCVPPSWSTCSSCVPSSSASRASARPSWGLWSPSRAAPLWPAGSPKPLDRRPGLPSHGYLAAHPASIVGTSTKGALVSRLAASHAEPVSLARRFFRDVAEHTVPPTFPAGAAAPPAGGSCRRAGGSRDRGRDRRKPQRWKQRQGAVRGHPPAASRGAADSLDRLGGGASERSGAGRRGGPSGPGERDAARRPHGGGHLPHRHRGAARRARGAPRHSSGSRP